MSSMHRGARALAVGRADCRGFTYAYLLAGIVLLGLIAGAVAKLERNLQSGKSQFEVVDAYAKSVIRMGEDLHKAAVTMWQDNPTQVLTLTAEPGGLYDPALSLIGARSVSAGATVGNVASRFMAEGSSIKLRSSGQGPDVAVVATDLREDVCLRINTLLYGIGSGNPFTSKRREGCAAIRLSCKIEASFVYYRVVLERSFTDDPAWPSPDCQ